MLSLLLRSSTGEHGVEKLQLILVVEDDQLIQNLVEESLLTVDLR